MLKNLCYIFTLLFITTSVCQTNTNVKQNKIAKLIISLNAFHNAKSQDAQAVAEILAQHIKEEYKLDYSFEVTTPGTNSEIEKVAGNDFDYIILTTEEYFDLQKKLPFEPYTTNYSAGKIGFVYHLIVNKADNIKDISQLKNETLYVLARETQKIPFLWLDKLLSEKGLPNQRKFFKEIIVDYKATNVLLPVFFKKAKACIITEVSLNLLAELNPAIKNNISILNSSDNILLGLGCLNKKKFGSEIYNILKDIIPKLSSNLSGQQLLKLFNADKLVPYKEEYLQNYLNLFKH